MMLRASAGVSPCHSDSTPRNVGSGQYRTLVLSAAPPTMRAWMRVLIVSHGCAKKASAAPEQLPARYGASTVIGSHGAAVGCGAEAAIS